MRIADATFAYGFEYLGVAERIIQTPLTDQCYLTLTQALQARTQGVEGGEGHEATIGRPAAEGKAHVG